MNDLSDLLHDAVDDIEPADRLQDIRSRTAEPDRAEGRVRRYAVGAVVLATAATVAVVAVLSRGDAPGDDPAGVDPARSGPPDASASVRLEPAYFIGDTTRGPRLFREYDTAFGAPNAVGDALDQLESAPADPDYTTGWAEGDFSGWTDFDPALGDPIVVTLAPEVPSQRPAGMSEAYAELVVQQLVYTLQAGVKAQAPVELRRDGEPVASVLGVDTSAPVTADPQATVVNQVIINDPVEGLEVTGTFTARGAANSFEANVPWELRDGETVVRQGFATATGAGDRLHPWETEVDLSGLAPGDYTFVASTDDPSGGEGAGPYSDTRTITVR